MISGLERRRRSNWSAQRTGECRLSFTADGAIIVQRADPHVWLEEDFLQRLANLDENPWVSLTYQSVDLCSPDLCCQRWRPGRCFLGAILVIRGRNEHAVYRITGFRAGSWEAQRSDL